MIISLSLIFLICAVLCFLREAFASHFSSPSKVGWTALGFAFITLAVIFWGFRL